MRVSVSIVVLFALATSFSMGADWTQFRGPGGLGISRETEIPVKWSTAENVTWAVDLPGPGASSPIVLGDRVFVTSYSGYGLKANAGDQKDLHRHILCVDRRNGKTLWSKVFEPILPEHKYRGEGQRR